MVVYAIQIIFIVILDFLTRGNKRYSKIYHFCVFISMVLIAGLRNPEMGLNDFANGYIYGWRIACNSSWTELFGYMDNSKSALKDPGFAVICKLLSLISTDEFFFQFVINIPYFAVLCWFVRKHSCNYALSYIVVIALQYFTLTYYLLRPMCAIMFIVLAIDSIIENRNKRGIIYTLSAATVHSSAIVFIIFFVVKRLKNIKRYPIYAVCVLAVSLFGRNIVMFILQNILGSSRFVYYLNANMTEGLSRYFIALLFLVIEWFIFLRLKDVDDADKTMLNMSMLGTAFLAFTPIIADFWRIAWYFEVVNCVLYPRALKRLAGQDRAIVIVSSYTVFLLYTFLFLLPGTNALPYYTYFS